jgi:hypothetical protein
MAKNTGTLVVDTIKTFDDTDKYAVVNSSDIKGGHHVVNYDTDRNDLVSNYPLRTETGMLVTVRSSAERGNQMTTYQLSGTSWINYADYLSSITNIWTTGSTGNIWYAPPSGNVGIGLTGNTITAKLTVSGDGHFYGGGYRITVDPSYASLYNYDTSLSILAPFRIGSNVNGNGIIIRPDLSNTVGVNIDIPTATLDINGSTRIRTSLTVNTTSTLSGITTHADRIIINHLASNDTPGLILANSETDEGGYYGVSMMYKDFSTSTSNWYTGVNDTGDFLISRGTYFTQNNYFRMDVSGETYFSRTLHMAAYSTWDSTTLNIGSTTSPFNAVVRALSNDTYKGGFEAYGNSNGSGYVYVGSNTTKGGGVMFCGDTTPSMLTPVDSLIFYRRNTSDSAVFYIPYNSSDIYFNGNLYFYKTSNAYIYHNAVNYDLFLRGGPGLSGSSSSGTSSGDITLFTDTGGTGASGGTYSGAISGSLSFYTGTGGYSPNSVVGAKSGDITLYTGNGGASTDNDGGDSGAIYIYTGNGGAGYNYDGIMGDIIMQYSTTSRGNVLIGTETNTNSRRLKVNGYGEATDWVSISDIREKENIFPFENALDKVNKLNTVYYNFITDNKSKKIGLIAQEVENVIPELVPPVIGDSTKGICYNALSAVLVKAIQEQSVIIENLKEEIENLKLKIN